MSYSIVLFLVVGSHISALETILAPPVNMYTASSLPSHYLKFTADFDVF